MRLRNDGSIQSSNVPTTSNLGKSKDHNLYRCLVTKITFTDDSRHIAKNSKNASVLYDVVVLGGFATGQIIKNCKYLPKFGSTNAFHEHILTPCTKDVSKTRLEDQDGDIVYVQFIQGHSGYPVIIGVDNAIQDSGFKGLDSTGLTVFRSLLNGVYKEISKEGVLTTAVGYTKDESSITTIKNPIEELITTTFKSGLTLTQDGKNDNIKVSTNGGASISIDGNSSMIEISAGSATILLDGNSGKISIQGDLVDLGSAVTDFVTKFIELSTAFNSHTHPVPQASSGVLMSAPPILPLLVSVGSQTVQVQD